MESVTFRALRVEEKSDNFFSNQIREMSLDSLPDNDVLIKVLYSSLNFKDALSAHGHKGVTRQFPHTPGIDAAGVVVESRDSAFKAGDEVIVTGYDLGMNTPGGFGEFIRVPSSWVIAKPSRHALRYFMVLGTAGLTAGLSVDRLITTVKPEDGEILVTGATGGVGSIAIALLSRLGYSPVALTSKVDHSDMLVALGAQRIIDRSYLEDMPDEKALYKETWAGVVDTVGGTVFSKAVKALHHSGAATTCGMVAGTEFSTSIFPFILRGISVFGIDSVEISPERKAYIWNQFDEQWALDLDDISQDISLEELPAAIEKIHMGKMLGRVVLKHQHQE